MSYTHFTLDERIFLQQSLKAKLSIRNIADILGRSPSSVSREIKRNSTSKSRYAPFKADRLAKARKSAASIRVLLPNTEEYDYVCEKLGLYWSPETICGRWHKDHPDKSTIGCATIYRHIHKGLLSGITAKDNLRRRGKPYKSRHGGQMTIHPNQLIRDWPDEISNRTRIGDWEGDTITGKIGSGLIDTLIDRKSRLLLAGKVSTKAADVNRDSIVNLLKDKPVESISFDNGVEFAEHEAIEKQLHTKVYFADPHCPWQRGSNENINGLLRFFFPRGSDFSIITQEEVDRAVKLLNGRPRKCLGWSTPEEIFKSGVALP